MNSFISNFKKEAPALAFVALALLSCELGLRASIRRASIDVRHIEEIPGIVARRPEFLFLGNSLTRAGVIPKALELDETRLGLIHPDDTTMVDWLYLYKRHVHGRGAAPRVLLVPFAGDQLSDSGEVQTDRLGSFGGLETLREAFRHDVTSFEDRVSYLLGVVSCAYANRHRIRTQVSAALIPHYKASAQVLNKGFSAPGERGPAPQRSYARLTRFLELMKAGTTKAVFVAMPVPALHEFDPALRALLEKGGARLVDLRKVEGLTAAHFPDGYHLSPQGGEVFSRELSRALKSLEPAAGTGR